MSPEPLSPLDAYTAVASTLADWAHYAEAAAGDGLGAGETTMLANASGRATAALITQLTPHRPVYLDGRLVCLSCVELDAVMVRAGAPCLVLRRIYREVLGSAALEHAAPGVELIVQDDPEPYIAPAAQELERMHNLPPAAARDHAASVVRALMRLRRHSRT